MEIQTFILRKTIKGPAPLHNARGMGPHSFYSLDGVFPLKFAVPYYLLARRDTRGPSTQGSKQRPEVPISLRFNIIDENEKLAGGTDMVGRLPTQRSSPLQRIRSLKVKKNANPTLTMPAGDKAQNERAISL